MEYQTQIELNRFKPRPYQIPLFEAIEEQGIKRAVLVWHRRAGKDVAAFNLMIRMAIEKIGSYYYILPTYRQARLILFEGMTSDGKKFLDFIPPSLIKKVNIQEMCITLRNSSKIYFLGSDNVDSLRGSNPQGIVFSEYAFQHEAVYATLRPVLVANDGWAVFISTPFGENHFYQLYQVAQHSPDWHCDLKTVEDTGVVSKEQIDTEQREGIMSPDMIQQEYYCFPPTQEVLALEGLKQISDIKTNDMVFTHTGRPRKVLDVIRREYEGELIKIHSFGSPEPLICTPCHPIRIYDRKTQTYCWKKAADITLEDRLVFPKTPLGNIPVINYELCMLIAWYICEGSSFKNGLQFTVGNQKEVDRVSSLLCKLNMPFSLFISENGTSTNIVVYNTQLVDFFKSICGTESNNKRIPFSWISSYEIDFFHELMWGDGCYSVHENKHKFSYTTTSKTLAYQVQLLANSLNIGYAAGITNREGASSTFPHGKTYECQDSYAVQIYIKGLRQKHGPLTRAKYGIAARIKSIEKEHYKGPVHNIKVQYDESYIVLGRAVHNCSFSIGALGSYYSTYLNRMELNGQISEVPWEPSFKVHTAWDLGLRDETVIIFFQVIGNSIKLIDVYANSNVGLEHYIHVVLNKEYTYGKHIAPHDIRVRDYTSGGLSRWDKAQNMGLTFTMAPKMSIVDGIETVRTTLPRIWLDRTNCKKLISAIRDYRKRYDEKLKRYDHKPLHDHNSNYADALRYLCVGMPLIKSINSTPEELERRYQQARMGGHQLPEQFRQPY